VYRFLLTPRWLGFAALMVALSAAMVGLGWWQLSRFHQRSAINGRIEAAAHQEPVPVMRVLSVGQPPPPTAAWTRVSATGRYDQAHQVLARDRAMNGGNGYEVLTPLVLDDGTAVLVDRGWLAAPATDAATAPPVPAATAGTVTVTGRVHLPESRPDDPRAIAGQTEVRRIDPGHLASAVPYPLAGGYVLLDSPADAGLSPIPSDHENAVMNAGYVVQWWAFAALTLAGLGWAARREARGPDEFDLAELHTNHPDAPVSPGI
jgi:cytochrome oxidase assembly protein ShyY1